MVPNRCIFSSEENGTAVRCRPVLTFLDRGHGSVLTVHKNSSQHYWLAGAISASNVFGSRDVSFSIFGSVVSTQYKILLFLLVVALR